MFSDSLAAVVTLSLSHIKQVNEFHSQHLLSDQIGNYYVKLKASLTKKFYIVPDWQKQYKEKVPWFKCHGDTSLIFEAIKGIIYTHSTHWSENTNQAKSEWQSAFNLCYPPELSLAHPFPFFLKGEYQFMQIINMTGRSRYFKCISRISEVPTSSK